MELFKLLGKIVVDNSEANKALTETSAAARETADDFEDVSSSGEKSSSKLGKVFSKIGSGALALGKTVATGLAAGATALGGLTVKALSAAGELEQNMGGSEAVFKEYATKMQDTAKNAFSNMGLSTSDFLATANKMGALFQGAGFDIETSATMSSDAMQRAADVASIMGIDTASAMEAIAGAAKGNFTMMDNLGVAMNDTTLQAYALSKGIDKSTSEMTNQEKIGLAMEMFMEKTAYAAGNYAKENETLAGSLGTAKAALSNFLSGAGSVEDVVSSFSNFANVVVKNITSMFPSLMTGITQLVNQLVPLIPPLLEQVLPGLIEGATGLINGLVAAMPQIVQALLAAAPALIQGVTLVMNTLIAALPALMQSLVAALPALIPALVNGIVSMIVTLCTVLPQIIQPIVDNLPLIIQSFCDAIVQNLPILITGMIDLIIGIVDALPTIVQALIDSIPYIIEMLIVALMNSGNALIDGAIRLVGALVGALPQILLSLTQALPKAFVGIWNGVKTTFMSLPKFFTDRFNAIVEAIAKIFSGVVKTITKPFEKARDAVKSVADKIKGFFKGEISMPKIKMPHFSVSPSGWKIGDLLKGSIPKLGIEWYAKAMNNPMVMTKPTIFGYNAETGKLQGGGEVPGGEMIGGTNTIMNMISNAVASQNNTIVVYLQHLIEILATYFPQILEAAGHDIVTDDGTVIGYYAPKIDEALGKIKTRKERGR